MTHNITDAYGQTKKNDAMQSTWGHMYPEPGAKYYGEMVIAHGDYGDQVIVTSDFPGLDSSPMRFHLEQSIFDHVDTDNGNIFKIKCALWFFKTCHDMYLGEKIGKIINIKVEPLI